MSQAVNLKIRMKQIVLWVCKKKRKEYKNSVIFKKKERMKPECL